MTTGHSLGGALAAYIGTVYSRSAYIYDSEAFVTAASQDYEAASISNTLGWPTELYPSGNVRPFDLGGVHSYATTGEFLSANRAVADYEGFGLTYRTRYLDSNSSLMSPFALHSAALQVSLQWASLYAVGDWKPAGSEIWSAFLGSDVGDRIEETAIRTGALGSRGDVVQYAIAYSAATGVVKPFGDTALTALFDDAVDLSTAKQSCNPSLSIDHSKQLLANVAVEYAARLGIHNVLAESDQMATGGIFSVADNGATLNLSLQNERWTWSGILHTSAFKDDLIASSVEPVISIDDLTVGLQKYANVTGQHPDDLNDLIQGITYQIDTPSNGSFLRTVPGLEAGDINLFLMLDDSPNIRTQSDIGVVNAVVGTSGANMIYGSTEDNIFWGGEGTDYLDGGAGLNILYGGKGSDHLLAFSRGAGDANYLFGGDDADLLEAHGHDVYLAGGEGNDVIDVKDAQNPTIYFGLHDGHDYVLTTPMGGQFGGAEEGSPVGLETQPINLVLNGVGSADVDYIFSQTSLSGTLSPGSGYPIVEIPGYAYIYGDLTIRLRETGDTITIQNVRGGAGYINGFRLEPHGEYYYSGRLSDLTHIFPNINVTFSGENADGGLGVGDLGGSSVFVLAATISSGPDGFGGFSLLGGPEANGGSDGVYAQVGDISAYVTAPADYQAGIVAPASETTGTDAADRLSGGLGSETLLGFAGDDIFTPLGGNDHIDGGDGRDTLYLLGSIYQFDINALGTTVVLTDLEGGQGTLTLNSIEAIHYSDGDVLAPITAGTVDADQLSSAADNAILVGGDGDDVLVGSGRNVYLFGGAGDDQITGGPGYDVIVGGMGADLLTGMAGSDRYLWSLGDGNDTIIDATGTDEWNDLTLQNVRSFEVLLSRDGDDLLITTARSGEVIRIKDQLLADASHGLEGIAFSNGQYWDRAVILQHLFPTVIEGSSGDDTLSGTDASELFVGGQGNDIIVDSAGDDIYQWTLGDGADLITNGNGWASQTDTIAFTAGISASDIIVRHELGGQDRLSFNVNSGGSVTVDGVSSGDNREVLIRFADGTVWDEATLLQKADENPTLVAGTSDDDSLDGSSRADLIDGLTGNDTLDGTDGSDIYVYRSGDGNDLIRDYGSALDRDVLSLLDLTRGQVTLSRVNDAFGNGNDLLVIDKSTGQTVRVAGQFADAGIEEIRFSDGTVLERVDIQTETSHINGTEGVDYFNISWSGFLLDPGMGDDVITVNRTGSGTILFGEGYGHDRLQSILGSGFVRTETLDLQGLNSDDVTLRRASNGLSGDGLIITVNATGDTFNAIWQFNGYDEQAGLEYIHFADGTLWSRADIAANVIG